MPTIEQMAEILSREVGCPPKQRFSILCPPEFSFTDWPCAQCWMANEDEEGIRKLYKEECGG